MQYMNKLLTLSILCFVSLAFCLPAGAQVDYTALAAPPLNAWGVPIAYGNFGNGIVTTNTWTDSVGSAVATDSFLNGVGSPFGGPFGCGLGTFGPWQTGFGGNLGTQASSAAGASSSTTFGLQPIQLFFGI